MQPRWEVIADYPGNVAKVGSVFRESWFTFRMNNFDPTHYPAIYRQMDWWEKRQITDLPVYLKVESGFVFKTRYSEALGNLKFAAISGQMLWAKYQLSLYAPATEEEYNAYKAKQEAE